MVFRIEQQVKFFGENLFVIALYVSFGMIDSGDIGVRTEKVKNNLAEGNDVYRQFGVISSEGTNEGGKHNTVTVALSCKNDNAFRCFFYAGR